jgi:hypothetical protein
VLLGLAALYTWWRAPSMADSLAAGDEGAEATAAYVLPLQPCPGSGGGTVLLRRWKSTAAVSAVPPRSLEPGLRRESFTMRPAH